jgi:hypothetical protein
MKERKIISEVIEEKIEDFLKGKKSGLLKIIKKNGKYTTYKKVLSLVNQELSKKMSEIKKMNYKEVKFFEKNGVTVLIEINDPIESEEVENELAEYYENEGCFFQYAEGKETNYICVGTKIDI